MRVFEGRSVMAKKREPLEMTPEEYERLMALSLLDRNILTTAQAVGNPQKHTLDAGDLRYMNIPEIFWEVTLDKVTPSVRSELLHFETNLTKFEQKGSGLFLYGLPGVGKTAAAVVLLKFVRERYRSGYFIKLAELRDAMRYQHDFDASETISERLRTVNFLVIDALSAHDISLPYSRLEDLLAFITYRGEKRRPTLITSTLAPSAMAFAEAGFFSTAGDFLVLQEVTGENRRQSSRAELSKLLKGG
jgi:DNA replication protein DnaC